MSKPKRVMVFVLLVSVTDAAENEGYLAAQKAEEQLRLDFLSSFQNPQTFPAGLGAKAACPQRPVVVFTGDAGFWYHMASPEFQETV